jgi:hypothetical protein
MFNEGNYWDRALYGDLHQAPVADDHIQRKRSGQPPCTHSQLMAYQDEQGRQVAIVHQFRRPDGTLGGEGRPDPKLLLQEGVLYVLDGWSE